MVRVDNHTSRTSKKLLQKVPPLNQIKFSKKNLFRFENLLEVNIFVTKT